MRCPARCIVVAAVLRMRCPALPESMLVAAAVVEERPAHHTCRLVVAVAPRTSPQAVAVKPAVAVQAEKVTATVHLHTSSQAVATVLTNQLLAQVKMLRC
jgi:hypothetical protein